MKTRVLSIRIPEGLERIALMRAKDQRLDKATVVRQWVHQEAERYVLGLVQEGRISFSKAAEILDITIFDLQDLAVRHGVELGPSDEQLEASRETARQLAGQARGTA
jgi:predicted HTH domain antitoxin